MDKSNDKQLRFITAERWVNISILLIGLLIISSGILFFKDDTKWQTILISVGSSIAASSIVAFLSSIYIRRYRTAKELAESWGIVSIEEQRALMNIRIDENLQSTRHKYDIMAYGLKSLRDSRSEVVEGALKRGTKIRILTVDPTSEDLKKKDEEENIQSGSTAYSISDLITWVKRLADKYPQQCELHVSHFLPSLFFCREDDYIYVGPYQYGKESQRVITTEYKRGGKGFEYYNNLFEDLWNNPKYCEVFNLAGTCGGEKENCENRVENQLKHCGAQTETPSRQQD